MKTVFTLFVLLLASASAPLAFASCDGIPVKSDEQECTNQTNRMSCELVQGCKWTTEAAVIKLCNQTSQKLAVATRQIRPNHNVIHEEGWWILEANQCQLFEAPNATSFSYFAKQSNGHSYWFGNGEPLCYDPSGSAYSRIRQLTDSCGQDTEIQAYQTIPVKEDDVIVAKIEGPGQDLSPETFIPKALAWAPVSGNYSVRKGSTLEEAKANALHACQSDGEICELALWLGGDRLACMAILSGTGAFRAWAWSYDGQEVAINQAMDYCRKNGQTCTVDFAICNDK